MAVIFDVRGIAEKRGIKNPYELAKRMGTTYTIAQRHLNSDRKAQITAKTLDALCDALGCEPCDIVKRVPEKKGRK